MIFPKDNRNRSLLHNFTNVVFNIFVKTGNISRLLVSCTECIVTRRGILVDGLGLVEAKSKVDLSLKPISRISAVNINNHGVIISPKTNTSIFTALNFFNFENFGVNVVYEEIICMVNYEDCGSHWSHRIWSVNITHCLKLGIRAYHISDNNIKLRCFRIPNFKSNVVISKHSYSESVLCL